MALLEKQLKAGNGSFMFFVDGAGRALEWANSYHFQAISPSTAQRGKAMSIKSLIYELTVASVLLAGCGPSQFVWVRGDEVTTTDSPLNFYDNAKPVSRDHAVCLEKFETCESTSRTVNDFGCPNAYSYCMDAAGYRKVPRQGKQ